MLPPHLQDLNPAQLKAVQHGNGPLLIFAGAGSGKTRVLTRRIAHLVLEHRVHPTQILAVTFTNKAAREMKQRVAQLFSYGSPPTWVATFHSTCARILRRHAGLLDYSASFVIYDRNDSNSALKRVYRKLNLDPRVIDLGMVSRAIDRAKNEYRTPEEIQFDRYTPGQLASVVAEVYAAYQQELLSSNAMDFGDLLCNTINLFRLEPQLLEHYQNQFVHLLIDEYQDTNRVQYLLVQLLTEKNKNICVVGDDDQSIYAFRGATIENILNFKKDFPGAKVITLAENYRSTKNILQAAKAVITKNKNRQDKNLRTGNPVGQAVVCFRTFDETEEADFVVREITSLVREGCSAEQIAVFYRTNAQSRSIEEALVENGIPYEIFGGHRFYDRKEIKDILAYFKVLINPDDNESLLRIINTPSRGLGATSVGKLVALAAEEQVPLLKAIRLAVTDSRSVFSKLNKKKFAEFLSFIDQLREDTSRANDLLLDIQHGNHKTIRTSAIAELLQKIADKSSYLRRLEAEDSLESQSRLENIYELFNVATEFVRTNLEEGVTVTLSDFLDRASLSSDIDEENGERHANGTELSFNGPVRMMTLHLAKGLEFDIVFIVGLEEGLLPHVRSLDHPKDVEEERRLCYVGITRAKKKLYFTRACRRLSFGRAGWYSGLPSRFLEDLPSSVIDDRHSGFLS